MKKCNVIFLCVLVISLKAQYVDSSTLETKFLDAGKEKLLKEKPILKHILQIAPLIGTDIGFAIPYGHIPKSFQPFPKLNVSLGLWFNYVVNTNWQVGLSMTYKTVGLTANAKMIGEEIKIEGTTPIFFTGIATQSMNFTMLEFPLMAKYGFGKKGKYRISFGGYGAWIGSKSFSVTQKSGYIGDYPGHVGTIIDIKNTESIDFSDALRDWEAGVVLGYEQSITSRLNFDVTLYSGLNDIVIPSQKFLSYSMLPFRIGIHLTYSLFEFAPSEDQKFRFVYK